MNDLDYLIKNGYINKTKHPEYDIYILNYTPKTQYECLWNETTKACRGLIIDSKGNFVSRCFKKFFNYNEVKKEVDFLIQKKEKFTILEKYDGSLGVSYHVDGQFRIATRGSFTSHQAIKASKILRDKYSQVKLDPNLTYLFEIIYPENRIVLDYGKLEDIILLSIIDTKNNVELDLNSSNPGFVAGRQYSCSISELLNSQIQNFEGYVVKFDNGFRFKIKLDEYVRLHKLIFGLSSKSVWESLKEGKNLDLDGVPDEIFSWIKRTKNQINSSYTNLEENCKNIFSKIKHLDRKEFAKEALKNEHHSVLFKMYDDKDYQNIIWEKVRPSFYTCKESDE